MECYAYVFEASSSGGRSGIGGGRCGWGGGPPYLYRYGPPHISMEGLAFFSLASAGVGAGAAYGPIRARNMQFPCGRHVSLPLFEPPGFPSFRQTSYDQRSSITECISTAVVLEQARFACVSQTRSDSHAAATKGSHAAATKGKGSSPLAAAPESGEG